MKRVAFYFWWIDPQLSDFTLRVDDLAQSYMSWVSVLKNSDELDKALQYVYFNAEKLGGFWFPAHASLFTFVGELVQYKDVFYDLLGQKKLQRYLVLLMNTAEKRPNGWFFGSFAVIEVENGFLKDMKIVDSYYPNFLAPHAFVQAPEWASAFLPSLEVGFISANKIGFTAIDGANIKYLYEKIYHQDVKWVVFLRSDLLELLIPGFEKKFREWQFANASIDLIRWASLPNKKEFYIKGINEFLKDNKLTIFKKFVNNFDLIKNSYGLQIYLSNVHSGFQQFLIANHFTTTFRKNTIYAWDSNDSFNKIDRFVSKVVQISDSHGTLLIETDKDRVDISSLPKGSYEMKIFYGLNVPDSYRVFIAELEKKYAISLTEREQWILWLIPAWATRGLIYLSSDFTVEKIWWTHKVVKQFKTPFSQGIYYELEINQNKKTAFFEFYFQIN